MAASPCFAAPKCQFELSAHDASSWVNHCIRVQKLCRIVRFAVVAEGVLTKPKEEPEENITGLAERDRGTGRADQILQRLKEVEGRSGCPDGRGRITGR